MSAATLTIPLLGRVSAMFGFVPLSAWEVATVLVIVSGYIAATEIAKPWFYRGRNAAGSAVTGRSNDGRL